MKIANCPGSLIHINGRGWIDGYMKGVWGPSEREEGVEWRDLSIYPSQQHESGIL